MQQLCLTFNDLSLIWEEFLPYVKECWKLQDECWSAGNCYAWWKSRFYDFYVGHGRGNWKNFYTMDKFEEFWDRYGLLLQRKE